VRTALRGKGTRWAQARERGPQSMQMLLFTNAGRGHAATERGGAPAMDPHNVALEARERLAARNRDRRGAHGCSRAHEVNAAARPAQAADVVGGRHERLEGVEGGVVRRLRVEQHRFRAIPGNPPQTAAKGPQPSHQKGASPNWSIMGRPPTLSVRSKGTGLLSRQTSLQSPKSQ
jgi:hypothetical protein